MAIVQAVDYLEDTGSVVSRTKDIYNEIRSFLPVFTEDTPQIQGDRQ